MAATPKMSMTQYTDWFPAGPAVRAPLSGVGGGTLPVLSRPGFAAFSSLVAGLQHECDHCDDSFQEEVKEQNGGGATNKPVKDQEYLPSNSDGCRHPKTCGTQRNT